MAEIVPLAGKNAAVTVNAVTVKLTRGRLRVGNQVLEFATTGQTLDTDSNAWMQALSGINRWSLEADGYVDHNATAAARLIGDNIKFRPGTTAAGTFQVLLASGHGFSGAGVVSDLEVGWDAEGNKPDSARVSMTGNGALTYINS